MQTTKLSVLFAVLFAAVSAWPQAAEVRTVTSTVDQRDELQSITITGSFDASGTNWVVNGVIGNYVRKTAPTGTPAGHPAWKPQMSLQVSFDKTYTNWVEEYIWTNRNNVLRSETNNVFKAQAGTHLGRVELIPGFLWALHERPNATAPKPNEQE